MPFDGCFYPKCHAAPRVHVFSAQVARVQTEPLISVMFERRRALLFRLSFEISPFALESLYLSVSKRFRYVPVFVKHRKKVFHEKCRMSERCGRTHFSWSIHALKAMFRQTLALCGKTQPPHSLQWRHSRGAKARGPQYNVTHNALDQPMIYRWTR